MCCQYSQARALKGKAGEGPEAEGAGKVYTCSTEQQCKS